MVRIAPDYLAEFSASVDRKSADTFFFSCGAMRSLGIVADLEARLAKPVVVSNQAMIWDTWRLAGIPRPDRWIWTAVEQALSMADDVPTLTVVAESPQPIRARLSADEIHATLRDRICLLEYAPGSLLREALLAEEFGVSRTPIREILQRLAQEGLVSTRNGVGTLVRPLDFDADRRHLRDAAAYCAAHRRAVASSG